MPTEETIPLFPLGVVLMPHAPLPLHIFEERYKTMIGQCLEANTVFGVIYYDGKTIGTIGCTAEIVEVLDTQENGEMDILTVGRDRFVIRTLQETGPYLEAAVTYFDDPPEKETDELVAMARQGLSSLKALDGISGETSMEEGSDRLDPKKISFLISAHDGFSPDEKQRFLEMTSTRSRLASSVKALQKVFQRRRLSREIQETIGGNGNIKKILARLDAT